MLNQQKLNELPTSPGVYLMKDEFNNIIYVGKAVNLKNRVRQYFQSLKNQTKKVQSMVQYISDFEIIVTDTELEALILECNLIKKYKPRFNVMLKDDKSYPYVKITINEKFPRVIITREVKKDGAKYFGPYTSVFSVKKTIEMINKLYPIKMCNKHVDVKKDVKKIPRPCLNYHIKQCVGVCQGEINKKQYQKYIEEIIKILSGKQSDIISKLEGEMKNASEKMDFELAAKLRDQITGIKHISEKQKVISLALHDQDVIAFANNEDKACVQVFFIREGKLIGREHFMLEGIDSLDRENIMTEFIKQFYTNTTFIPKEILLQEDIDEAQIVHTWLKQKKGSKVVIKVPRKGEKKKLVEMVENNATITLDEYTKKIINEKLNNEKSLVWLKEKLNLKNQPSRIEAFDISNIKGTDNVGSMIVFKHTKPDKKSYRRFKINTIDGQDDYGSMQEIVFRRIERGLNELKNSNSQINNSFLPLPDIIMVDGGLGHVNAINTILSSYDNIDIPVCGMVKNETHRLKALIFKGKEIEIPKSEPIYYMLNNISEEVHRFAISYHRKLRNKRIISSELDEISLIGEKRRKELLKHFKGINQIKHATIDELLKVEGINRKVAINIYNYFNK